MDSLDWRLSVEEVAAILSTVSQPEMAHDLMMAQLGDMSREEAHARLLAASHSLLARGYLNVNESGELSLSADMSRVAGILTHPDFSIRYTRSHQPFELTLAFHFSGSEIYAHSLENGILHHLTLVERQESVTERGLTFFALDEIDPFTCPKVEMPYAIIEQIKDEDSLSVILKTLEGTQVPQETRTPFAEDVHQVQYRGSILRVEYEDSKPQSDEGLLVLRGTDRLWLLRLFVRNGNRYVTLLPGTEQAFRQEVIALL